MRGTWLSDGVTLTVGGERLFTGGMRITFQRWLNVARRDTRMLPDLHLFGDGGWGMRVFREGGVRER